MSIRKTNGVSQDGFANRLIPASGNWHQRSFDKHTYYLGEHCSVISVKENEETW